MPRRSPVRHDGDMAAEEFSNAHPALEYLDAGGWQFLTFAVQPEDEHGCRVYQTLTALAARGRGR